MSCFHPLPAHQNRESGSVVIGRHLPTFAGEDPKFLELPCSRCVGCRMDHARSWSIRIMHEAQFYDANIFLTLDYSPEKLPKSLSLEYGDFQGFMKRLRKEVRGVSRAPTGSYPVRFFVSGEYGERFGRPHWHALLFNCWFGDQVRYCNDTYRSALCERLWGRGNVVIGSVTPSSAAYVAGYTLNKVYGQRAEDHYEDVVNVATGEVSRRRPEFCEMSNRPGIGSWWYSKYGADLFPADHAVVEGKEYKVPRFYWNKFQESGEPLVVEGIRYARLERARAVPLEESSDRRRSDREVVAKSRLRTFSERSH